MITEQHRDKILAFVEAMITSERNLDCISNLKTYCNEENSTVSVNDLYERAQQNAFMIGDEFKKYLNKITIEEN